MECGKDGMNFSGTDSDGFLGYIDCMLLECMQVNTSSSIWQSTSQWSCNEKFDGSLDIFTYINSFYFCRGLSYAYMLKLDEELILLAQI